MPRHPPCALYSLTFSLVFFKNYMSKSLFYLRNCFYPFRKNLFLYNLLLLFFRIVQFSRCNADSLCFGGDEESRTPDPLLARQVLSQLSYTPIFSFLPDLLSRQSSFFSLLLSLKKALVGLSGLEPPTSRLSGVCSNQLSYKPIYSFLWSSFCFPLFP